MTRRAAGGPAGELGMTLVEVLVLTAIVAIVAAAASASLAQRPAQAAAAAVAFAGLASEARALAAVSDDPAGAAGSGATIEVVRDGTADVATLYRSRPIPGANPPAAAPGSAPLRTFARLAIVRNGALLEPPFAIFISAAGHASAAAPYTVGVDAPLAAEPACALATGIVVAFRDGVGNRAHALSCATAQLDLGASLPVP